MEHFARTEARPNEPYDDDDEKGKKEYVPLE